MIRKVREAPDVTPLAIRVAVMTAGLPLLFQWIVGYPIVLTGHSGYKKLAPFRLPGGKTLKRDLAELIGEVTCNFCELQMPLKSVVKYQFLISALNSMLEGEVFNLDAVLDDFSWICPRLCLPIPETLSCIWIEIDWSW